MASILRPRSGRLTTRPVWLHWLAVGAAHWFRESYLFLDEMGEFPARTLDSLRQPLEEGVVTLARKGMSVTFPAAVQLVGASNPCPCGYAGDRMVACQCLPAAVARYRRRLSGPLLDRFDLRVAVRRLAAEELEGHRGESSAEVAARVEATRAVQRKRRCLNRDLSGPKLDELAIEAGAMRLLSRAVDRSGLTARGYDRVRRVARTLADLDQTEEVGEGHVAEALALRGGW